jgi:hypothetical protein
MRQFLCLMLFLMFLISCKHNTTTTAESKYRTAVSYNDAIVGQQSKILNQIFQFVEVSDASLDSADHLLDTYGKELEGIILDVKSMPPFKGDSSLRDAAISSFGFYRKIMGNEYKDIVRLRKEGANETKEGVEKLRDIVQHITDEEEGYDKNFRLAQQGFAKKYNITLTDNDMQKKIDKLNQ